MRTAIEPAVSPIVATGLLVRWLCTDLLAGVNFAKQPTTTRGLETHPTSQRLLEFLHQADILEVFPPKAPRISSGKNSASPCQSNFTMVLHPITVLVFKWIGNGFVSQSFVIV